MLRRDPTVETLYKILFVCCVIFMILGVYYLS